MNPSTEPSPSGSAVTANDRGDTKITTPTQLAIDDMLRRSLILPEEWEALSESLRADIRRQPDNEHLLGILVQEKLLTGFQAGRHQVRKNQRADLRPLPGARPLRGRRHGHRLQGGAPAVAPGGGPQGAAQSL